MSIMDKDSTKGETFYLVFLAATLIFSVWQGITFLTAFSAFAFGFVAAMCIVIKGWTVYYTPGER